MDKLQNNGKELLMLNVFFEYLKTVLMAGLFFPLRKMPGESIDFLARLENIQSLDSTVQHNAENAKQANLLAIDAAEIASQGGVWW